jgi:acyl carrier protein
VQTRTPQDLERWVLETCAELGVQLDNPDADFFEAGATSLTAARLIARVEATFGEDALPPDDLFEKSKVRDIAESIYRSLSTTEASG